MFGGVKGKSAASIAQPWYRGSKIRWSFILTLGAIVFTGPAQVTALLSPEARLARLENLSIEYSRHYVRLRLSTIRRGRIDQRERDKANVLIQVYFRPNDGSLLLNFRLNRRRPSSFRSTNSLLQPGGAESGAGKRCATSTTGFREAGPTCKAICRWWKARFRARPEGQAKGDPGSRRCRRPPESRARPRAATRGRTVRRGILLRNGSSFRESTRSQRKLKIIMSLLGLPSCAERPCPMDDGSLC